MEEDSQELEKENMVGKTSIKVVNLEPITEFQQLS
jgi:hypothetical protein